MMPHLRVGIVRYASVGKRIADTLGVHPGPEVILGSRIRIIFRSIGGSRWPEEQQMDFALQVADVARRAIAIDSRRSVRRRAGTSAIVVVFEDATLRRGCSVVSRWECIVPASGSTT